MSNSARVLPTTRTMLNKVRGHRLLLGHQRAPRRRLRSVVFLGAILATVVYLTVTHADQTELAHHERADA